MNIDWNKMAKNALRSAQKRIDSVLDIVPDEEIEDESLQNTNDEIVLSDSQWDNVSLEPYCPSTIDNFEENVKSDSNEDDANSNIPQAWKSSDIQTDEVVVSEPNPIRDRDNGLFHHSPSNSPDDDLCCEDDNQIVLSTELHQDLIENEKCSGDLSPNSRSHDETQTVISSDIEVLRKFDSESMTSCTASRDTFSVIPEMLSSGLSSQLIKTIENLSKKTTFEQLKKGETTEASQFKMHAQHQERRIIDLQRQNQLLQRKINELLAIKASARQQSSVEAKLMKKLSDKEAELSGLLLEGEKLAEQNGKLTKEMKRLRALLSEQEMQLKKSNQAEIDRDVARDELRALTNETTKLRSSIKALELELSKQKISEEGVTYDLKKKDEKIEKLKWSLQEVELDCKNAYEQIQKLEAMNRDLSIRSDEQECISKGAEEITKGLYVSIEEERRKYENQTNYVESLEKRLSDLMDSHRNTAEMIAAANAPLYENISRLENELVTMKELHGKVLSEKLEVISLLTVERDTSLQKVKELDGQLSKIKGEFSEMMEKNLMLASKLQNAEKVAKTGTQESSESQRQIDNLRKLLKTKENELDRVYSRLREESDKSDGYETIITDKQSQINALISRNAEMESDLFALRTNLAQKRDRFLRFSEENMDSSSSEIFPHVSVNAAQAELADVLKKYDQSMRQIALLEAKIISLQRECDQTNSLRTQLKDLRMDYENLLEAHGEKIELIEELQYDLADVKKLLKDQVQFLLGME